MNKLFLILGALLSQQAFADIYKCQEQGTITITDSNTKENFKHCVLLTEHKVLPSTKVPAPAQTTQAVKIDPQTQETRDNKRKQILLSELKTEEEALQAARKNGLADDVHLHQQNIELLNKEIRRIQ